MSSSRNKYSICGIYEIYNIINGKVYIGQAVDIFKRKIEHFTTLEENCHYNTHLQRSFNKYGKECFKFQIIEECEEIKLNEKEVFYIEVYDSFYSGYNQTLGGDGASGRKWNENQYKIMSEKMKGNKYGNGNKSHKGLTLSEETKNKIGKSLLGRKRGKYKVKNK